MYTYIGETNDDYRNGLVYDLKIQHWHGKRWDDRHGWINDGRVSLWKDHPGKGNSHALKTFETPESMFLVFQVDDHDRKEIERKHKVQLEGVPVPKRPRTY